MSTKRIAAIFIAAIFLLTPVLCMAPTEAHASVERRAVARRAGNFYDRASANAGIVDTFNRGTLIRHVAQHGSSETWMSARLDGERVFVRRADIVILTLNSATDQSTRRAVVRRNSTATIYRHPTVHARVVENVPARTLMTNVVRWDQAGRWAQVTHNGNTGFVQMSDIVILSRNTARDQGNRRAFVRRDGATIRRHPSTHARVVENLNHRAQIHTVQRWDQAGRWARVVDNNSTVGFVLMSEISLVVRNTANSSQTKRVTFTERTSFFSAASTQAPVRGSWNAGRTVHATAHNSSGSWLTAQVDGRRVFFRDNNARVSYHVRTTNNATLNRELERTLNRVVNDGMTRSQMKRALYDDTVRRMVWTRDESPPSSGWRQRMALTALQTNRGNCFGFAARFAALSQAIGYDARAVSGHIRTRTGNQRHGWVEITTSNGVFVYDPQLEQNMGISFYRMPFGRERVFYVR
ncbi:MAG: transglutaminase domain-containing protein [Coriobacteriia bacterium]|nr:transglutaminase domain-containing protein [Coriobacteriia bacterium]